MLFFSACITVKVCLKIGREAKIVTLFIKSTIVRYISLQVFRSQKMPFLFFVYERLAYNIKYSSMLNFPSCFFSPLSSMEVFDRFGFIVDLLLCSLFLGVLGVFFSG